MSTRERAVHLLGTGLGPEIVASAIGVTTSTISQYLSDPEFTSQVAELRYKNLSKHNDRDATYDAMEDTLLARLNDLLPLMLRPLEVLKAIQVINAAKRRGANAPEHIMQQNAVVTLVMPAQIINKFTANINNQIVMAGEQKLNTMQSGSLLRKIEANPET